MFLIKARNLKKNYGVREIVKGINFSITQGEVLAVIGPNGSGKSTTLEMLVGLRKKDGGEVNYWIQNYKEQIGMQLQSVPFFPGLTALENIRLFAAFYKIYLHKQIAEELLQKCGLLESSNTEATRLSGGQQKRLAIATAMVHNPKLIFLDEPTAALDPLSRQEIHQLILRLYEEGKTVVLTSHDMDEVKKLATRILMISNGEIIAEGSPEQLCNENQVHNLDELYLKLISRKAMVSC
ncbi:ABC transporter ATP-binding protein [Bacillus sp. 31A1R]|uniref:ABC transporter ATP-binding protein n=1 Tax=Robertmurraya mangrovi TaxID=3098077 RepID=A0ABU5ITV0_9BACI|nr:ABC transporter ATP-binding protein [Bacillus sp. 31A1R]MDZ5470574.1 ABC transporter ATP-binding protein [Bacillus sp. 31A1R]